MKCPSCYTISSFVDYEQLIGKNGFPILQVLFYCSVCQSMWTKRIDGIKHKNPAFITWAINDIKKNAAPMPDRMKFRTERGFVI